MSNAAPKIRVFVEQATPRPVDLISDAMATCYCSERGLPYERALKRVGRAVSSAHGSVLEHAGCTLRVEGVSRACMAQLTRHRMASFCVESQRYVKYGFSELDYADKTYIPPSIKFTHKLEPFSKHMEACQQLYNELVDAGVPAQDARYVLPEAMLTSLVMTVNARELFHILDMRLDPAAQWEIQLLAETIERELRDHSVQWNDLLALRA